MEPVTIAAGLAVAGELLRLSCAWMSTRAHRGRVEREVAHAEPHRGS